MSSFPADFPRGCSSLRRPRGQQQPRDASAMSDPGCRGGVGRNRTKNRIYIQNSSRLSAERERAAYAAPSKRAAAAAAALEMDGSLLSHNTSVTNSISLSAASAVVEEEEDRDAPFGAATALGGGDEGGMIVALNALCSDDEGGDDDGVYEDDGARSLRSCSLSGFSSGGELGGYETMSTLDSAAWVVGGGGTDGEDWNLGSETETDVFSDSAVDDSKPLCESEDEWNDVLNDDDDDVRLDLEMSRAMSTVSAAKINGLSSRLSIRMRSTSRIQHPRQEGTRRKLLLSNASSSDYIVSSILERRRERLQQATGARNGRKENDATTNGSHSIPSAIHEEKQEKRGCPAETAPCEDTPVDGPSSSLKTSSSQTLNFLLRERTYDAEAVAVRALASAKERRPRRSEQHCHGSAIHANGKSHSRPIAVTTNALREEAERRRRRIEEITCEREHLDGGSGDGSDVERPSPSPPQRALGAREARGSSSYQSATRIGGRCGENDAATQAAYSRQDLSCPEEATASAPTQPMGARLANASKPLSEAEAPVTANSSSSLLSRFLCTRRRRNKEASSRERGQREYILRKRRDRAGHFPVRTDDSRLPFVKDHSCPPKTSKSASAEHKKKDTACDTFPMLAKDSDGSMPPTDKPDWWAHPLACTAGSSNWGETDDFDAISAEEPVPIGATSAASWI